MFSWSEKSLKIVHLRGEEKGWRISLQPSVAYYCDAQKMCVRPSVHPCQLCDAPVTLHGMAYAPDELRAAT